MPPSIRKRYPPASPAMALPQTSSDRSPIVADCAVLPASSGCWHFGRFSRPPPSGCSASRASTSEGSIGALLRERTVRSRPPAASNPRDCAQIALHAFELTLVFASLRCTGARKAAGWGATGRGSIVGIAGDLAAPSSAARGALQRRQGRRESRFVFRANVWSVARVSVGVDAGS